MFVYLLNKPNPSPNLGLIIERVKFEDNNVFVNKMVGMRLDLNLYNIILYIYVYNFSMLVNLIVIIFIRKIIISVRVGFGSSA